MNVFVFFFSWTSIFSKTARCPSRPRHMCFFSSCSSLRFASNAHTHPSHSTHTLHGARAQIHSMCHGISFSQTSTNINSIIINYSTPSWFPYTKCNSDQFHYKMKKMFLTKWLVQPFKNTIWSPNFPIRTNRQFPITNIHKNHLVFNKHPQTYSCFPYKMWISNT